MTTKRYIRAKEKKNLKNIEIGGEPDDGDTIEPVEASPKISTNIKLGELFPHLARLSVSGGIENTT